jgi:hypothetical protein
VEPERRAFGNRGFLIGVLAFSLIIVVQSFRGLHRPGTIERDPLLIAGLIFGTWVCLSISIRTTAPIEKIIFGAMALASVIGTVLAVSLNMDAPTVYFCRVAKCSAWIVASGVQIKILIESFR